MPCSALLRLPCPPRVGYALVLALSAALFGCDSEADNVCGDITNCSHGGSDDWVTACRDQVKELSHEATASGCAAAYDAYFTCADDHFECHGNQSSFPGCESRLAALETCLEGAKSANACGELSAALDACGAAPAEPSEGGAAIEPCATGGVCSAHCYLDSVADVCAPSPEGLYEFAECASHCVL